LFNRSINNKPFVRPNNSLPITKKESNKWLEPSLFSRDNILTSSEHSLYVMDREADIYEVMSSLPNEKSDFLIRAKHNRRVLNAQGKTTKLAQDLETKEIKAKVVLRVNGESRKRSKRQAKCEIRYETYRIPRPPNIFRKLLILGMEASVKVMQLKAAREGESEVKTDEVFSKEEILFLEVLNQKLQGQTEKLRNPHLKENLAWASWIIARHGGWKGYQSQRPPGTITFKRGLESYYQRHEGFLAALEFRDMCKR